MVDVVFSKSFNKSIKKLNNASIKETVKKHIIKIINSPEIGKPLRYNMRNERTVYVKPFRIIYSYSDETITFLVFEHRDYVYET
jgi:mRNA-degrading endonuclease RelE of RelBE toxin-antitoxin system